MPRLSWNEVRARAARFAEEWQDATYEKGETQSFYNDFFQVFGGFRRSSFHPDFLQTCRLLDAGAGMGTLTCVFPYAPSHDVVLIRPYSRASASLSTITEAGSKAQVLMVGCKAFLRASVIGDKVSSERPLITTTNFT